jgi:hypothetical protein
MKTEKAQKNKTSPWEIIVEKDPTMTEFDSILTEFLMDPEMAPYLPYWLPVWKVNRVEILKLKLNI